MPPRESDAGEVAGLSRSPQSLKQFYDVGDALLDEEIAKTNATGLAGAVDDCFGGSRGKTTLLKKESGGSRRDLMALFGSEVGQRKDIGDGWTEDSVVGQESLPTSARAMANAMGDAVTFGAKDVELCLGVLGHGKMKTKGSIGGRAGRNGDLDRTGFGREGKRGSRGRRKNGKTVRSEIPV